MSGRDDPNDLPPLGIGVRDDDLVGSPSSPGHLATWLQRFRATWLDGATRNGWSGAPSVPHVGRAGTTAELSEILSMTATANAHQYRRYLASDDALGNLLELDSTGLGTNQRGDDTVSEFALDVLRMYDDTVLDALAGGTDLDATDVPAVVERTMRAFRELEWTWNPATQQFTRQTDDGPERAYWKQPVELTTSRSKALQKQRRSLRDAIETTLTGDLADVSAFDVRITNLLFQDMDNADDVVPVVAPGVQDHLRALLTEDYDTVRRMGSQLEYDEQGRVSNEFKKEAYLDVVETESTDIPDFGPNEGPTTGTREGAHESVRATRTTTTFERAHTDADGNERPLFTEAATLANIGDDAYSLQDGANAFANYEPESPIYQLGMSPTDVPGGGEEFMYEGFGNYEFYPMRQRRARYEKLSVLHELGVDDRYAHNPAVLGSLSHHLFRFSLMRARHSALAREVFLDGSALADTASEFYSSVGVDLEYEWEGTIPFAWLFDKFEYGNRFDELRLPGMWWPLDLGSVDADDDPRLEQVGHSLRYLQSKDDDTIDRLVTNTLDLASHRFDAWWTSIATKRLASHRHDQGNWYQPKSPTYTTEDGANAWQDERAYVPPADLPEWPPAAFAANRERAATEEEATPDSGGASGSSDGVWDGVDESLNVDTDDLTDVRDGTEFDFGTGTESALDGRREALESGLDVTVGGNDLVREPSTEAVSPSATLPSSSAGIHVGAWGYVEDLHPDPEGGEDGEFLHAPSLEQATTAAVLRGGHKAFENQDDGNLSAVDLSADRVRVAKQLLEGVREGQPLGALLGYRFERALHEAGEHEHVQSFREAYPAFTGTLGGPKASETAARSDVVDGYSLYRSVTFEDASRRIEDTPPRRPDTEERPDAPRYRQKRNQYDLPSLSNAAVAGALWHLFEAVDAVRDVLTAESVHQFTQGNYSRAQGSLEALASGEAIPEPQVVDTPRTSVGLTHRLVVAFGDADAASTPAVWTDDTAFTHPRLPAVGDGADDGATNGGDPGAEPGDAQDAASTTSGMDVAGDAVPGVDDADALGLQQRRRAEPNLDAWVGDLLPDPADVGCEASYRWSSERAFEAGTFRTPAEGGRVSVADVGFEPDVLVLTAEVLDGDGEDASSSGARGVVAHGSAKRDANGVIHQQSQATVVDATTGAAVGRVDADDALAVPFDAAGDDEVRGTVSETTADGFAFDVAVGDHDRTLEVSYLAVSVTDPGLVSVGRFDTPASDGQIALDVDADTVVLAAGGGVDATQVPESGALTAGGTDAVETSYGHASTAGATVTQHAVGATLDPTGRSTATVEPRDDRVVHLPGEWSLECTGLGGTLDLAVRSSGSTPRPVTYVAFESPPDEPTPEVGVLDDETVTLDGAFDAGAIEFVAIPGVTESDLTGGASVSLAAATPTLGHGVAAGVTGQHALGAHRTQSGNRTTASHDGAVVAVPTGDDKTIRVELASVDDDGFTVEYADGEPEDALVLYRAWPAAPVEREFAVETTLAFDELRLSPLDALACSQTDANEGRTQLEEHVAFHLRRHRHAKATTSDHAHPPIPSDATIELRFREDGGARVSVADFLELVRPIRETLADGRPATADDLAHPAEAAGTGYDAATFGELSDRASTAQDALEDVAALLDNRIARLAPPREDEQRDATEATDGGGSGGRGGTHAGESLCEQVDAVADAVSTFQAQVPVSGIETACSRVAASNAPDALVDELEALVDALPAGPITPGEAPESVTVDALAGQTLTVRTDYREPTMLSVTVLGNSGADTFADGSPGQFVATATATTTPNGLLEVPVDCSAVAPGTPLVVVATDGDDDVVVAEPARVVAPSGTHVLDVEAEGGRTQDVVGVAHVQSETQVSVAVTSDQAGDEPTAFDATATTTTQGDGSFAVSLDLRDVRPGTAFSVTATTTDGDVVYDADGYVRHPTRSKAVRDVLADLTIVPRLLWLAAHEDALDPAHDGSPAAVLADRLSDSIVDWPGITAEVSLLDAWRTDAAQRRARATNANGSGSSNGSGTAKGRDATVSFDPPAVAIGDDDVQALQALAALPNADVGALATAVADALEPLQAAGVDDAVDVLGGEDHFDDARLYPAPSVDVLARTRTALAQLLANPAGRELDVDELQVAPSFLAAVHEARTDVGERAPAHVRLVFEHAPWFVDAVDDAVDAPAFLARLRRFVAYPDSLTTDDQNALASDLAELGAYYRRLDDVSGYQRALTRAKRLRDVLDERRVEREMAPRAHDIAVAGTNRILADLRDLPEQRTADAFEHVFESIEEPLEAVGDVRHVEATERAFEPLVEAIESLREHVRRAKPWTRVAAFDERFEGVDAELGADGQPSRDATPSTEFAAVCTALEAVVARFDDQFEDPGEAPVYRPADSRQAFRSWWVSTASALSSSVSTALAPLATVARSAQIPETFRRCVLETVRIPLLRASYFGVYASTPRSATGGEADDERTLLAQARSVRARIAGRLADARTEEAAVVALAPGASTYAAAANALRNTTAGSGSTATDGAAASTAAERELDRLRALFGEDFVVLPPLSPPNQAALAKTFAATHQSELLSAAGPMATETWLQRHARVRDRPAAFQQALSYAEMVSGSLRRDGLDVGQLPYEDADDWIGVDGLEDTPDRGRVGVVASFATRFHADHPIAPRPADADGAPGAQLAGFLVDDWRESIPSTDETTGVAVNYDDPSTEPPQSILLAVPPEDGDAPWSTDALLRTITESVDLAKLRGVDLDVVGKPRTDPEHRLLGHLLPGLTFPHNTRDVPDAPTVDFDLDVDLARDLAAANGDDDARTDGGVDRPRDDASDSEVGR